jgi:hypothetical protein
LTTYHVSGHLDLTPEEFARYYIPWIEAARAGARFVVGDAPGADAMFIDYAAQHELEVTVYHMFGAPRRCAPGAPTVGGYTTDEERDAAMTAASDADIAWVRPGREHSGTAKNLKRRAAQRTTP